MAEFLLKPNDFQKQVDSFKTTTETVTALKYTLEKDGVSLQSLDKYVECITAMNDLIAECRTRATARRRSSPWSVCSHGC